MQTKQYEIKRPTMPNTEITVPHSGNTITFIYKPQGPDTYANVAEAIDQENLETPTMAQTASLLHPAFQSNEQEFKEIKVTMENRWLWAFTGTLYVPNKGAYIQDNPQIKDKMPSMEESDLIKKLESDDSTVRFVPFGFEIRSMTPRGLARNPYIIALATEEGADKLAEVAGKYRNKPYLRSFTSVDKPLTRVSTLGSDLDVDLKLSVCCGFRGNDWYGCGFGIKKLKI